MIDFIIALAVLVAVLYVAKWIIDSFFPPPVRIPALLFVGLIAFLWIVRYLGYGSTLL